MVVGAEEVLDAAVFEGDTKALVKRASEMVAVNADAESGAWQLLVRVVEALGSGRGLLKHTVAHTVVEAGRCGCGLDDLDSDIVEAVIVANAQ